MLKIALVRRVAAFASAVPQHSSTVWSACHRVTPCRFSSVAPTSHPKRLVVQARRGLASMAGEAASAAEIESLKQQVADLQVRAGSMGEGRVRGGRR